MTNSFIIILLFMLVLCVFVCARVCVITVYRAGGCSLLS